MARSTEIPIAIAAEAEVERLALEAVDGPVSDIHIERMEASCSACGSHLPVSELHRDSRGRCECGGDLIVNATVSASKQPSAQTVQIEVVKP